MGKTTPRAKPWWLLGALVLALACSGKGGTFKHPVVRVDLRPKLPAKVRKVVASIAPSMCAKTVTLPGGGQSPQFVVSWTTIEMHGSRYITGVEVSPKGDGKIAGVDGPKASAAVAGLENAGSADKVVAKATVALTWSARKGCSKVEATTKVVLRADATKGCKKPKVKKLLRPVK